MKQIALLGAGYLLGLGLVGLVLIPLYRFAQEVSSWL